LAEQNGADKAEVARKISRIVANKPWRLDAGFTQDKYDSARGNESSTFAQLGYQFKPGLGVYGRYENALKYGASDNTAFAGGYWRIIPDVLVYGEAGVTQSPAFRPSSEFQVGAELLTFKHVQPLLSYRQATYDGSTVLAGTLASGKGNVGTITPGIRIIFPGITEVEFRYSISENIDRSITQVSQLRFNIDAEEALPPQPSASFKAYALGAVYKVNPQWSVRGDLSHESRPNFYTRSSAGMGLSYLF
jgi:hypothetical protein